MSIPKDSVVKAEQVTLATAFSEGPQEIPDEVESVSPAYLIQAITTIEFSKDVLMKLQHVANLETAEDCEDMVVLQAGICPLHDGSSAVHIYKQVEGTTVEFTENGQFGVIRLKSLFSTSYKIGKKKREDTGRFTSEQDHSP